MNELYPRGFSLLHLSNNVFPSPKHTGLNRAWFWSVCSHFSQHIGLPLYLSSIWCSKSRVDSIPVLAIHVQSILLKIFQTKSDPGQVGKKSLSPRQDHILGYGSQVEAKFFVLIFCFLSYHVLYKALYANYLIYSLQQLLWSEYCIIILT